MLKRLNLLTMLVAALLCLIGPEDVRAAGGLVFDDPSAPVSESGANPKPNAAPLRPAAPVPVARPPRGETIPSAETGQAVSYTPTPAQTGAETARHSESAAASDITAAVKPTAHSGPMPRAVLLFTGYFGKGATQKYPEYSDSDIAKLLNSQQGLNTKEFIITTANDRYNTYGSGSQQVQIVNTNDIRNMPKGLTGAQDDGELAFIKEHYSILLTGNLLSGAAYAGEDLGTLHPDSGLKSVYVEDSAKGPASASLTLDSFAEDSVKLAKRLIAVDSSVKIWFAFPPIAFEALAERYTQPYMASVADGVKRQLSASQWNNNVAGFYYGTEAVPPWYTYFDAETAGHFGNPVVKNMSALSGYVRGLGKKFMWIPYYGPHYEGNNTSDDVRLGTVANATDIFDYVVIQPSYYFSEPQRANLGHVAGSLAAGAVKTSAGAVAAGGKTSNTVIGVEMELDHRTVTNTAYAKRYTESIQAFGPYKRTNPVVFYAGDRDQLMYPDVIQAIHNFFK